MFLFTLDPDFCLLDVRSLMKTPRTSQHMTMIQSEMKLWCISRIPRWPRVRFFAYSNLKSHDDTLGGNVAVSCVGITAPLG